MSTPRTFPIFTATPARPPAPRSPRVLALGMLLVLGIAGGAAGQEHPVPPLPHDAPVMLVGDPGFRPERLEPFTATFAMGPMGKSGPMAFGERVDARAHQTLSLERTTRDGRAVLIRHFTTRRPDGAQMGTGQITLDAETLLPLASQITQGGTTRSFDYDWTAFVVTQSPAPADDSIPARELTDLRVLEAGVHDIWMAALPLREGFSARIPVMMAGGGGKYWAVPRVVGSEKVDIGDGTARDAWVVELDWWGMGKDSSSHFPGGGINESAGSGGKYWVLKSPPSGVPAVVRIRTEVDADRDSLIQLQSAEE